MQANGTPSLDAVLDACLSADKALRSGGEAALKAATRRPTAVRLCLARHCQVLTHRPFYMRSFVLIIALLDLAGWRCPSGHLSKFN